MGQNRLFFDNFLKRNCVILSEVEESAYLRDGAKFGGRSRSLDFAQDDMMFLELHFLCTCLMCGDIHEWNR